MPKEQPAPAAAEPKTEIPKEARSKKVAEMSLSEIEQKLKQLESQGGFGSDFARHLLARKKTLSQR